MPTFVYLAPLTLFFLIGGASATIATVIYAAPPAIRITAHAIRSVPETTVEAADSLGATRWQALLKVLLPMSKRTVVMGVNQTIMAALAMVTIAALIDAPGLGKTVVQALQSLDVGTAFNAGLAIVVMAIVLDRVTTAASGAQETARRSGGRSSPGGAPLAGRRRRWSRPSSSTCRTPTCGRPSSPARAASAAPSRARRDTTSHLGAGQPLRAHQRLPRRHHQRPPQPVPDAAHRLPVVARRRGR